VSRVSPSWSSITAEDCGVKFNPTTIWSRRCRPAFPRGWKVTKEGAASFSHQAPRQGARWLLPTRRPGPMPRDVELVCARPGLEIAVYGSHQEEHGFAGGDGHTSYGDVFHGACTSSYLVFGEDHLDDLAAALDDLLARKAHLASRRPVGENRQGASTSPATVDLAAILRQSNVRGRHGQFQ
jgi:hypothetical protein